MTGLQVAVFDTAFHQSMPAHAYMYALPYDLYEKHAIRKYGFHGTSYLYLLRQASKMLKKPENELNLIACHIGEHTICCCFLFLIPPQARMLSTKNDFTAVISWYGAIICLLCRCGRQHVCH